MESEIFIFYIVFVVSIFTCIILFIVTRPNPNPRTRLASVQIQMQDFQENTQDECAICFDNHGQKSVTLLCKHSYHDQCIKTWSIKSKMCPICRNDMTVPPKNDLHEIQIE